MASICGSPVCAGGKPKMKFTYTGDYVVRKDGVVELLTSGTIVFLEPKVIDLFMVGGGGAGGRIYQPDNGSGGGGGGYTRTLRQISVSGSYSVVIGSGAVASTSQSMGATQGGASSFGNSASVDGGYSATTNYSGDDVKRSGANGGSGGGGGMNGDVTVAGYGLGGSDGANGGHGGYSNAAGGTGQGTTTREFGESTGKLYAGGGGGGNSGTSSDTVFAGGEGGGGDGANLRRKKTAGVGGDNTGGGGGGGGNSGSLAYGTPGGNGGSGIVCFRESAELPELAGTWVLNEKMYAPENAINETLPNAITIRRTNGTTYAAQLINISLTTLTAYPTTGGSVEIYSFRLNIWSDHSTTWTFPAGATASDEFRAWLASNATKQA